MGNQTILSFIISKIFVRMPPKILRVAISLQSFRECRRGNLPLNTKEWKYLNNKKAGIFGASQDEKKRRMIPGKILEYERESLSQLI